MVSDLATASAHADEPTAFPATPISGWYDYGYFSAGQVSMMPTGTGRTDDWHLRWPGHQDMYNEPAICSYPWELLYIRCAATSCGGHFTCVRDYLCPVGTILTRQTNAEPICVGNAARQEEKERPDCPSAGNPINPITGNKYQKEQDYLGGGPYPLVFERHYNSRRFVTPGRLGPKWRHTFERSVEVVNVAGDPVARVYRPNGRILAYGRDAALGAWVADPDIVEVLEEVTDPQGVRSGWRYATGDNSIEEYDAQGRLTAITNLQGLRQTLTYNGDGLLRAVSDPYGRTLSFAYEKPGSDGAIRLVAVTDPAGAQYRYRYDAAGNLTAVIYPDDTPGDDADNPVRQYHYEDGSHPSALTGVTDENGVRFATWSYDAVGRAISSTHAGGAETTTLSFDDANARVVVTDSLGHQTTMSYSTLHGVRKATRFDVGQCSACGGAVRAYGYDGNGFLASRTDQNGNVTTYVNDARGLELTRTQAAGTPEARTIATEWHPDLRLPTRISEPGRVTEHTYDQVGRLLRKTESDPITGAVRAWVYGYTASGLLRSVNGPRTDVADITRYAYDGQGNRTSITNALGQVTRITAYDAHGRPLRVVDPNGTITRLDYDARGHLVRRTVSGATTTMAYDAAGNLTRITESNGTYLDYAYDDADRLVAVRDSVGNRIAYTLDAMGNRIGEDVFDGDGTLTRTLRRVYNDLNRLVEVTGADDQVTRYGYDANGNETSVIDPMQQATIYGYDALDRLVQDTDRAGGLTRYAYDSQNHLTSVSDPRQVTTAYGYDGLGNLTEQSSPDTGITRYAHDVAGNVTERTDARGITVRYEYDALNRLIAARYPDPTQDVVYTYDQDPNGVGHLNKIAGPGASISYLYDSQGNVVAEVREIGSAAYTIQYGYDAAGNLTQVTLPSGRTVDYQLDAAARVVRVDTTFDGLTETVASQIGYLPFGPMKTITYGNGHVANFAYDLDQQLRSLDVGGLWSRNYTAYDPNGNILEFTEGLDISHFGYDALDRIIGGTGGFGSQVYGYDPVGNRISFLDDGGSVEYRYGFDSNRLKSETGWVYAHDPAGNRVQKFAPDGSGYFYIYGDDNRLARVVRRDVGAPSLVNTVVARYTYDPLGRRVRKAVDGLTTHYLYDTNGSLIAEAVDGQIVREYIHLNGQPLAVVDYSEGKTSSPDTVILDDGDAETLSTGTWRARVVERAYEGDYLISNGGPGTTYRWSPVLERGAYDVYVRWVSRAGNATNVPYAIRHGAITDTVLVDQTGSGRGWESLGRYVFTGDGSEYVEVSGGAGQTTADAVRFVSVGAATPGAVGDLCYLHNDHLGTPRAVSCAAGEIVWRWESDPFGTSMPKEDPDGDGVSFALNLRFPGQYFDQETGLHYNMNRYFDPAIGGYITSDLVGVQGGLNTYLYARGNALAFIDPLGLAVQGSWIESPRFNIQHAGIDDWFFVSPSFSIWGYLKIIRLQGHASGYVNLDVRCVDDCKEWEVHDQVAVDAQGTFDAGPNIYALAAGFVAGPYAGLSVNMTIAGAGAIQAEYRFLSLAQQKAGPIIEKLHADGPTLICRGASR